MSKAQAGGRSPRGYKLLEAGVNHVIHVQRTDAGLVHRIDL